MPDSENLRGAKSAPPCASALPKKTPVHPSVKLKNSMYLITCDFKFFNTILAKFSGDPWVMGVKCSMGHVGRGSV
jgi:hypothetical protein